MFLELADGREAVHGVPGEAADTLGDDQIDLARKRIIDHPLEPLAPVGAGAADALVGVDSDELPLCVRLDHGRVIVHLRFV